MNFSTLIAQYLAAHPEAIPGDYHDIEGLFRAADLMLEPGYVSGKLTHSLTVVVTPGQATFMLTLSAGPTAVTLNGVPVQVQAIVG